MFDKLKQVKQMRDQAIALQKQLAAEKVEVEEGDIRVVVTGDQRLEKLEVDGEDMERVAKVINKAMKKVQRVAAQKLATMSGGLSGLLR